MIVVLLLVAVKQYCQGMTSATHHLQGHQPGFIDLLSDHDERKEFRKPTFGLKEQLIELQAIGPFESCKHAMQFGEMLGRPIGSQEYRGQAIVVGLHFNVCSGRFAVLILRPLIEFPHPVGRIAAVADQSEWLAVAVKPMRYRCRRGDGKIRSDRLVPSRVRRFVHVQKQHRTLNACRLKDPRMEDSGPSRRFPVDPIDRVTGSVFS